MERVLIALKRERGSRRWGRRAWCLTHARVVTVQTKPRRIGEAARIYRDSVVPAAKQQSRFKAALLLTTAGTDKGHLGHAL